MITGGSSLCGKTDGCGHRPGDGEELDLVVKSVADRLREISEELSRLPPAQE